MEFTKDDLKVGYVVENGEGTPLMVAESHDGKFLIRSDGDWMSLKTITTDMKFDGLRWYNIQKVFGFNKFPRDTLNISYCDRELLWERKKENTEGWTLRDEYGEIIITLKVDDEKHKIIKHWVGTK